MLAEHIGNYVYSQIPSPQGTYIQNMNAGTNEMPCLIILVDS